MSKKICFAASSGGHLSEIMMLKPIMQEYDSFLVTEKTQYNEVEPVTDVFYLKQVNRREITFLWYTLVNTVSAIKILAKEKPDIVITTGVLSVVPLCILCKIFGKKLIYIESYANFKKGTLTGKLLKNFADTFFVQWESLLPVYPNAVYVGGIY